MTCRAVFVLCAATRVAAGDPDTAKQHATAAETLAARGDLAGAAARFREAFAADPRPEYICNVGVAYYKADDLPRAHRYLHDCQTTGTSLDRAYLDNVRVVLESVEKRLAEGNYFPVDFAVEPTNATIEIATRLPHDEAIVGSRRVWFPFGTYSLAIRATGFAEQTLALDHRTRDPVPARVKLERARAPIDVPVKSPGPARPPGPAEVPPSIPSRAPAIVASAATLAAGITAGVLYRRARSLARDATGETDFGEFEDRRDAATRAQRVSWVIGGMAGVGVVVSGLLWHRVIRSRARVDVAVARSGGMLSIGRAW